MAGLVATNYGDALFVLAKESEKLDVFYEQLGQMSEVLTSHQELASILKHPKLAKVNKKKLLLEIFKGMDTYLLNFTQLLIDKSRFAHFNDIVKVYIEKYNTENNIEVAYVQSAKQLSDTQIDDIKAMLEKHCKSNIVMNVSVNPSLLAGLRIKVKGKILDNTAATRLMKMKENVLKSTL